MPTNILLFVSLNLAIVSRSDISRVTMYQWYTVYTVSTDTGPSILVRIIATLPQHQTSSVSCVGSSVLTPRPMMVEESGKNTITRGEENNNIIVTTY